jgi:hypothetical protein
MFANPISHPHTDVLSSYTHRPDCFKRAAKRIQSNCGRSDINAAEGMDEGERVRGKNHIE